MPLQNLARNSGCGADFLDRERFAAPHFYKQGIVFQDRRHCFGTSLFGLLCPGRAFRQVKERKTVSLQDRLYRLDLVSDRDLSGNRVTGKRRRFGVSPADFHLKRRHILCFIQVSFHGGWLHGDLGAVLSFGPQIVQKPPPDHQGGKGSEVPLGLVIGSDRFVKGDQRDGPFIVALRHKVVDRMVGAGHNEPLILLYEPIHTFFIGPCFHDAQVSVRHRAYCLHLDTPGLYINFGLAGTTVSLLPPILYNSTADPEKTG